MLKITGGPMETYSYSYNAANVQRVNSMNRDINHSLRVALLWPLVRHRHVCFILCLRSLVSIFTHILRTNTEAFWQKFLIVKLFTVVTKLNS